MFENEMQTRAAICGAGILLTLIFFFAHLPLILFVVPVIILFLGLVADPEETHAVWYGMLPVFGIFDLASLTDAEKENFREKRHYFWFGEVGMAAALAGVFAVPAGIFLAGKAEITLAFIGAAVVFLPLFVFLPKLIRRAMKADVDSIIETFGKNEQVKKVFWTVFAAVAGMVLTKIMDPVLAQQIIGLIARISV
ncbi:hypothetical protein [Methanoregula sp.]|uniref:hypothetical protein n=1 Tax=Methanoregula sp. TaxID=2052170 RepID=UPI002619ECED|nr:hypothetical protein [Methanoregula sp.]MDD5144355.1 hypothetical protein [Methanoregula sp.]